MTAIRHSYKEAERQRREDTILVIAEQHLIERGYANLNMDDLADAVGISKPTLYLHFKSKDELVMQVLLRSYKATDDYLSNPLDEPAMNRLIGLIRRSITLHTPGSVYASLRSDVRPDALWKTFRNNPDLSARRESFWHKLHALVDKAKEEGDIDSSIPTSVVTQTLLALSRSLTDPRVQADVSSSPKGLENAIDHVIRVFLHGVTPLPTP